MSRDTDLRGQLGGRVKQLRTARRMTQEQLAERSGLSHKFVGEVERGAGNPSLTTMAALAAAMGVTLVDLLSGESERPARLSARQATQVREALASLGTLVELASPPQTTRPRTRKR